MKRFRNTQQGFSLVELLVSMAVGALLLTGVLAAFNLNARLAKVQTQVADMQQSSRISQYDITRITRMAGRGGLPGTLSYTPSDTTMEGVALELTNNVPANTTIGDTGTPEIAEGTDMLTLRGVFSSSVYQVNTDNSEGSVNPTADSGTIILHYLTARAVPQDLQAIADAVEDAEGGDPDCIVLVSSIGTDYAVVELTGGVVNMGGGQVISVELNWAQTGGTHSAEYLTLTAGNEFPPAMTKVAYVGLLEEYRYYIRDDPDGPNRLSRARFYPATQTPHISNPNAQEDIADDVVDLQIAFGIDADGDNVFNNATEWLWDSDDDDPTDLSWSTGTPYYLRINTIARTNRPDPKYLDPALAFVEDREYDEPEGEPTDPDERLARSFRRKLLQNTVDLRNLG